MAKNKNKRGGAAEPSREALFPHFGDLTFWMIAGVVFALFTRPLVSGVAYSWSNAYFQMLLAIIFAFFVLKVINGRDRFCRSPAGAPLAAFLLWAGVSTVFSVYPAASLRELYNFCSYALLFFLAVNLLRSDRKREVALNALFVSSAVVSAYAVYQYFWGLDKTRLFVELHHAGEFVPEFISRLGTQRAFSTFVYPPALAGFLAIVIPAAFGMFLREKSSAKKLAYAGVSALCAFALILTYSKGGWLALAAAAVFFAFLWMKYIVKKRRAGAVIALLVIFSAAAAAVFSGVEGRATVSGFAASYRVRYEYWLAAPGMISEYPLTGSGPATWGAVYPEYKLLEAEETQMAHNNFVQAAAETGPAGLVLFLWFFGAVVAAGLRRLKEGPAGEKLLYAGSLAGIAAFLVQSLGEFTLYIPGAAAAVFLLAGIISGGGAEPRPGKVFSPGRRILYSLTVLLAAVLFMAAAAKPMAGDRHFEQARERLEEGDFIAASMLLARAAESFPKEARYYYYLGMLYERRPGFLNEAAAMYERAVQLNPHSSALNSRLANVYWVKSRGGAGPLREKALFQMEEAVRRYPFSPLYRISLGRMYHLAGRKEAAAVEYRKAVEYESGERMSARREILLEQLDDVKRWLEELEEEL